MSFCILYYLAQFLTGQCVVENALFMSRSISLLDAALSHDKNEVAAAVIPSHWTVSCWTSGVRSLVCLGFPDTTLSFLSSVSTPSQAPGVLQSWVGVSLSAYTLSHSQGSEGPLDADVSQLISFSG